MESEHFSQIIIDPKWVELQVSGLERRVTSIPERMMRHAVIVECISCLDAHELVAILAEVCLRSTAGVAASRELLQEFALEPHALATLSYKLIKQAYGLAITRGLDTVAGMFLGEPLKGSPTIDEAFTGNEYYDLPLGIRRSAARTKDRFLIDRLLHDRNHRVIELLLGNPRLIERDVVHIAARRPTRPEILEVVARHNKWASRYAVRKALACNPYTPHQIGRRLLGTLMVQDLKKYMQMGALPESLREEAYRLLSERHHSYTVSDPSTSSSDEQYSQYSAELHEAAAQLLSTLEIEDEETEIANPREDPEDADDDELATLLLEAESLLENAILVEVGEDEAEP